MKFKTILILRNVAIKSESSWSHTFYLKTIKLNKNKQTNNTGDKNSADYRGFVNIPLNEGLEKNREYLIFFSYL